MFYFCQFESFVYYAAAYTPCCAIFLRFFFATHFAAAHALFTHARFIDDSPPFWWHCAAITDFALIAFFSFHYLRCWYFAIISIYLLRFSPFISPLMPRFRCFIFAVYFRYLRSDIFFSFRCRWCFRCFDAAFFSIIFSWRAFSPLFIFSLLFYFHFHLRFWYFDYFFIFFLFRWCAIISFFSPSDFTLSDLFSFSLFFHCYAINIDLLFDFRLLSFILFSLISPPFSFSPLLFISIFWDDFRHFHFFLRYFIIFIICMARHCRRCHFRWCRFISSIAAFFFIADFFHFLPLCFVSIICWCFSFLRRCWWFFWCRLLSFFFHFLLLSFFRHFFLLLLALMLIIDFRCLLFIIFIIWWYLIFFFAVIDIRHYAFISIFYYSDYFFAIFIACAIIIFSWYFHFSFISFIYFLAFHWHLFIFFFRFQPGFIIISLLLMMPVIFHDYADWCLPLMMPQRHALRLFSPPWLFFAFRHAPLFLDLIFFRHLRRLTFSAFILGFRYSFLFLLIFIDAIRHHATLFAAAMLSLMLPTIRTTSSYYFILRFARLLRISFFIVFHISPILISDFRQFAFLGYFDVTWACLMLYYWYAISLVSRLFCRYCRNIFDALPISLLRFISSDAWFSPLLLMIIADTAADAMFISRWCLFAAAAALRLFYYFIFRCRAIAMIDAPLIFSIFIDFHCHYATFCWFSSWFIFHYFHFIAIYFSIDWYDFSDYWCRFHCHDISFFLYAFFFFAIDAFFLFDVADYFTPFLAWYFAFFSPFFFFYYIFCFMMLMIYYYIFTPITHASFALMPPLRFASLIRRLSWFLFDFSSLPPFSIFTADDFSLLYFSGFIFIIAAISDDASFLLRLFLHLFIIWLFRSSFLSFRFDWFSPNISLSLDIFSLHYHIGYDIAAYFFALILLHAIDIADTPLPCHYDFRCLMPLSDDYFQLWFDIISRFFHATLLFSLHCHWWFDASHFAIFCFRRPFWLFLLRHISLYFRLLHYTLILRHLLSSFTSWLLSFLFMPLATLIISMPFFIYLLFTLPLSLSFLLPSFICCHLIELHYLPLCIFFIIIIFFIYIYWLLIITLLLIFAIDAIISLSFSLPTFSLAFSALYFFFFLSLRLYYDYFWCCRFSDWFFAFFIWFSSDYIYCHCCHLFCFHHFFDYCFLILARLRRHFILLALIYAILNTVAAFRFRHWLFSIISLFSFAIIYFDALFRSSDFRFPIDFRRLPSHRRSSFPAVYFIHAVAHWSHATPPAFSQGVRFTGRQRQAAGDVAGSVCR